jgi:small subunit ribosomal protein S17e
MGNIKTTFVKRIANSILENHKEKFSSDYSKNKETIKELIDIRSKTLRNKIAGYITKKSG